MSATAIDHQPDFAKFRSTLLCEKGWKRPPLFDFLIDSGHKAKWLGRPIETPADDVAFYTAAGYDYVQAWLGHRPAEMDSVNQTMSDAETQTHAAGGVITDLDQFKGRRWSWFDMAEGDMSSFEDRYVAAQQQAEAMPEGMKVLLWTNDAFTFAWEMMGFNEFCLASYEQPDLIEALMDSLGRVNVNIVDNALRRLGDAAGALIYSDDIAYTEGLMLAPEFFRTHLFPHMRKMVEIAGRYDVPVFYHSDGKLYDVLDDLAEMGIRGVQPLEPKSMDPLEIKQRWPGKFCLLGNIDLDLMARGEPDDVERHVRAKIDRLNADGGYMPGVSNTVPHYVRFENYQRMIETVYSYPDESIA